MGGLFGTDGVRGIANVDLLPDLATRLARAAAQALPQRNCTPKFLLAKDTRISGDLFEAAAAAGLSSGGAEVILGGVMPTPAVSYLTAALHLDGGIIVSASHNPFEYNGLKFFGPAGHKLSDEQQNQIESRMADSDHAPRTRSVGRVIHRPALLERYAARILQFLPSRLDGLRVVVDCANGAFHQIAPALLSEIGADVIPLNCSPDGKNINEGGAVKPHQLTQAVPAHAAHAGLAFDGDGDRVLLSDENGALLDGDQILAIWANELHAQGRLPNNLVVGTLMTNSGLERFLQSIGSSLLRTAVGDRYVSAQMQHSGAALGGETCGHIIFLPHLSSADALFVGVTMLALLARTGKPLSSLASLITKRPQISLNIPLNSSNHWNSDPSVLRAIASAERALDGRGRILVRASGTEPVVRITAESDDEPYARETAQAVAAAIQQHFAH